MAVYIFPALTKVLLLPQLNHRLDAKLDVAVRVLDFINVDHSKKCCASTEFGHAEDTNYEVPCKCYVGTLCIYTVIFGL